VARYSLSVTASAAKELEAVAVKRDRQQIVSRIKALADNPRPRGCQKLEGASRLRVRQGHYRILYEVSDSEHMVTIVKVGHRRDVYR
jgi:mRNA interferase RelE/StbE